MNVKQIDSKHHIELTGFSEVAPNDPIPGLVEDYKIKATIRKTSNGQDIPDAEPTILFRARDRHVLAMLHKYLELCVEDGCVNEHVDAIAEQIKKFTSFKKDFPHLMKQPGITRGL